MADGMFESYSFWPPDSPESPLGLIFGRRPDGSLGVWAVDGDHLRFLVSTAAESSSNLLGGMRLADDRIITLKVDGRIEDWESDEGVQHQLDDLLSSVMLLGWDRVKQIADE